VAPSVAEDRAPGFSIKTTKLETVTLDSLLDGRNALVLMLMTSRCQACRQLATTDITQLHNESLTDARLAGRLRILLVSVQDSMESLQDYAEQQTYPFPVALDRDSLIVKFAAFSVPTVVVVAPSGVIHSRTQGAVATRESDLRRRVFEALGLGDETTPTTSTSTTTTTTHVVSNAIASTSSSTTTTSRVVPNEVQAGTVSFAFMAGIASFASPCSTAQLPAYVAYFVDHHVSVAHGSFLSMASAFGVLLVYCCVAAILLVGSAAFADSTMPWLPAIGGLLSVAMGISLLFDVQFQAGHWITSRIAQVLEAITRTLLRNRWSRPHLRDEDLLDGTLPLHSGKKNAAQTISSTLMTLFWFGITYGSASASCSAPVFIALLGMTLRRSIADAALVFVAFSLSVSLCVVVFTAAVCVFRSLLQRFVGVRTDNLRRASGIAVIVLGLKQLLWS
jgi:cytochrome c-type biogenesis protein